MERIVYTFIVLFAVFAVAWGFAVRLEYVYGRIFGRPLFLYMYFKPKKLSASDLSLLRHYSDFYRRLSVRKRRYFEHRLAFFLARYTFHGRSEFVVTREMQISIGSIYVMMTFGLRTYLTNVFDRILVYEKAYESNITGQTHKGEFNPMARCIVFSWEDFLKGHATDDNMHLGIHEFAHALHFHVSRSGDLSATLFRRQFNLIMKEVNHPPNKAALVNSGYFRDYAFTNPYEFLAVIMEHYFETPAEFKTKFPQLYQRVSRMLNHRHRALQSL